MPGGTEHGGMLIILMQYPDGAQMPGEREHGKITVLLSAMVPGDHSLEGFGDGTWGLGSQLSTLSTSAGTAIASISY